MDILQTRILGWVAYHFSSDLPNPGIETGSPALKVDSLPTELSGKPPKNCTLRGSNSEATDYETDALPAVLRRQN